MLAGSLRIGSVGGGGGGRTPGAGGSPGGGSLGGGSLGGFGGVRFGSIQLPLADLARSEPVVVLVVVGQMAAFVGLLVAWLVVLARTPDPATTTEPDRPRPPALRGATTPGTLGPWS